MKERQWYIELDNDEEPACYEKVDSWFQGVCELLKYIEKGVPFTCKIDFFYRDGGTE